MRLFKFIAFVLILAGVLAACSPKAEAVNTEYVLTTALRDGKFVFLGVDGAINGVVNPALHAEPGERITVMLVNSGEGRHDIVFEGVNVKSDVVTKKGETTSVTFTVPNQEVAIKYYDSTHEGLGMKGVLLVGAAKAEDAESAASPAQTAEQPAGLYEKELAVQAIQKGACGSCHTIAGVPNAKGVIAPDLSNLPMTVDEMIRSGTYKGSAKDVDSYIRESIQSPDAFIAPDCPSGPCQAGVMPATLAQMLTEDEVNAIVGYLSSLPEGASSEAVATTEQTPTTGADIVRDPTDLPGPIGDRQPTTVRLDLEAIEVEGQLADGTTFTYWTFNGQVPGPFFRVRVGDTIEVHMKNNTSSTMNHSVDFHAVTGPGGGAVMTQTKPGEETTFTAKALNPGLYVYHCATPMVAAHIANGMYGLILVEPEGGLPAVDREFYVMQGELYTTGAFGEKGHQAEDTTKLLNEEPEYFVFNGAVSALTDQKPLKANVGETVRIFFGVGGPNFTSSFHVIGEIFDRVYDQASLTGIPLTDVQTTLVPPGGATMVEFSLEVPGRYILVDHALSRLQRGLAGFLVVEGAENPDIFHGTPSTGSGH